MNSIDFKILGMPQSWEEYGQTSKMPLYNQKFMNITSVYLIL